MKNLQTVIPLLIIAFILSSCGSIFKPVMEFEVDAPRNSTVFVADTEVKKNKSYVAENRAYPLQVKMENKGYKDTYDVIIPSRVNIASLLNVLSFHYLTFFEMNPFVFDDYYYVFPAENTTEHLPNQQLLKVNTVKYALIDDGFNSKRVSLRKFNKIVESEDFLINSFSFSSQEFEESNLNNITTTNTLNLNLQEMGFQDTLNDFLNSKYKTLNIDGKVKEVNLYSVLIPYGEFYTANVNIEWTVTDQFGDEVKVLNQEGLSGKFMYNSFQSIPGFSNRRILQDYYISATEAYVSAVDDATVSSMYQLLASKKLQKIIDENPKAAVIENFAITQVSNSVSTLKEGLQATVTVKTNDGHGSGFYISNEGHVLTNYHVIKDAKKLEILKDSKKYPAELVHSNRGADLAILKIDVQNEFAFNITKEENSEIGEDIIVIGTPSSVSLPSTISKGIISGLRQANGDQTFLQTDAKISPGNSGGPILNEKNQLIGIVNSKLIGFGIEGIAFGLVSYEITDLLKLQYK